MKITLIASAFAVLTLTACETTPMAGAPAESTSMAATRITTSEQFSQMIVGKRLRHKESNWLVIAADGTMSGAFGGAALEGTWQWEGQYWCRTLTTIRPGSDCQTWSVNGNEITITRERGAGEAANYFFQ